MAVLQGCCYRGVTGLLEVVLQICFKVVPKVLLLCSMSGPEIMQGYYKHATGCCISFTVVLQGWYSDVTGKLHCNTGTRVLHGCDRDVTEVLQDAT